MFPRRDLRHFFRAWPLMSTGCRIIHGTARRPIPLFTAFFDPTAPRNSLKTPDIWRTRSTGGGWAARSRPVHTWRTWSAKSPATGPPPAESGPHPPASPASCVNMQLPCPRPCHWSFSPRVFPEPGALSSCTAPPLVGAAPRATLESETAQAGPAAQPPQ